MNWKQKLENFQTVFFGLANLAAVALSIVVMIKSLGHVNDNQFPELTLTLGISNIILTIVFVVASFYYLRKLSDLTNLKNDIDSAIDKNKRNEILLKNTSELISNLAYYQRHILNKMDYFLDNPNEANQDKVTKISNDSKKFLSTFMANIHPYFTLSTNDNCAITIKIVKDGKVKTFFRDAISYTLRKKSDTTIDGKDFIYDLNENFAFFVIYSKDYKDDYYFCDDLKNDKQYYNRNPHWQKFYNATAVAPISINIGELKKDILGFLCVDNFNGNLGQKPVESILNACSALLFPVLYKYEKISNFANLNNYKDGRIAFFRNWNNN